NRPGEAPVGRKAPRTVRLSVAELPRWRPPRVRSSSARHGSSHASASSRARRSGPGPPPAAGSPGGSRSAGLCPRFKRRLRSAGTKVRASTSGAGRRSATSSAVSTASRRRPRSFPAVPRAAPPRPALLPRVNEPARRLVVADRGAGRREGEAASRTFAAPLDWPCRRRGTAVAERRLEHGQLVTAAGAELPAAAAAHDAALRQEQVEHVSTLRRGVCRKRLESVEAVLVPLRQPGETPQPVVRLEQLGVVPDVVPVA